MSPDEQRFGDPSRFVDRPNRTHADGHH